MRHEATTLPYKAPGTEMGNLAPRLIAGGLIVGVLGLAVGAILGLRDKSTYRLFFHSYLTAYLTFLAITLGAIFFVMLQHLCRAGWNTVVRRTSEALGSNIHLLTLLFIPLLFGLSELFSWTTGPQDHIIRGKGNYLNYTRLLAFLAAYFIIWNFLAAFMRRQSIAQDTDGDVRRTRLMELVSAPGMILFGAAVTFFAFDWIMGLNAHWYSTIFGVYFFAGCAMSFFAALALVLIYLQGHGRLKDIVTVDHYHDIGKLAFTFVFFWGYIAFAQYMLIWYSNIPEETQFFLPRQIGPWAIVSLLLLAAHLLIPFPGLLSRHAKRRLNIFAFFAVWLILAQMLDMYYLVMPSLYSTGIPAAVGQPHELLPEVLRNFVQSSQNIYAPASADLLNLAWQPLRPLAWIITGCLWVGIGGLYTASTAWLLSRASLVPVRDPRLPESLAFENA